MSRVEPSSVGLLSVGVLERHEFSSQTFVPLSVSRWLVIVAPSSMDGRPDARRARAFVAGPRQGITYHAGTWHHGLTVLDTYGEFAVMMWRDDGPGDEEFVRLEEAFEVAVPSA